MNIKETKKNIIQAGHKAVEELIKVAKEAIVDSDDDISADRLKNAAATKKLAIFDAFEILNRIQEEENILEGKEIKTEVKNDTPRESITVNTPGKSMRQAYADALKLGFRTADESFEDYSARARKDSNYGKGGGSFTISGQNLIDSRKKKK